MDQIACTYVAEAASAKSQRHHTQLVAFRGGISDGLTAGTNEPAVYREGRNAPDCRMLQFTVPEMDEDVGVGGNLTCQPSIAGRPNNVADNVEICKHNLEYNGYIHTYIRDEAAACAERLIGTRVGSVTSPSRA